jgi:hypothetical protein
LISKGDLQAIESLEGACLALSFQRGYFQQFGKKISAPKRLHRIRSTQPLYMAEVES